MSTRLFAAALAAVLAWPPASAAEPRVGAAEPRVGAAEPRVGAAEEAPDASELLRQGAVPPAVAYAGEVSVVTRYGGRTRTRELLVSFVPPNRFRRELVDSSGYTAHVVVSDGATEWIYDRARRRVWKTTPDDADHKLLGPEDELDLLAQNYDARVTGQEDVAGRRCWVVTVRGQGESPAVRTLWIDRKTGLVLQSKSQQGDGTISSTMRFVRVEFPSSIDETSFRFAPPPGAAVVTSALKPGYLELEDARLAAGIDPVHPRWLPQGFVFESLNVLPHGGDTFLHFRYSDGVEALSLFQYPKAARLDFGELPVRQVRLAAGDARVTEGPDGKVLDWPRRGQRVVLVGNLPLETLRRVAESLE
ncbi:MAG: outer membrane lipoprotein-sorting protein [Elusimicrobia bacterium]|nr:outer membrane lipoprotein-sorting protein [Elusimicrobiota bacterium]